MRGKRAKDLRRFALKEYEQAVEKYGRRARSFKNIYRQIKAAWTEGRFA